MNETIKHIQDAIQSLMMSQASDDKLVKAAIESLDKAYKTLQPAPVVKSQVEQKK